MAPPMIAMAARPRDDQPRRRQALLLAASALLFLLCGGGAPGAGGVVAVAVAATTTASATPGLVFHVGGPRGWRVPDANTSYAWWAMNNRFHVGDSLYFRYGGGDSVLVVDREAFDGCNATEPVARFAGGATTVPLGRPGFFCFISGAPGHCDGGQRLMVRVMVHPAPGAPAPAPATSHPGASASGPGASSRSAAVAGAGAGAAVAAAAMGVLAGLVLLLQ
uniref:Phytocyanin domain-containing protein n=1 Tax=Oryza meridionalis TaxID=40149 RepID=A0A0E0C0L1_9ORYZ